MLAEMVELLEAVSHDDQLSRFLTETSLLGPRRVEKPSQNVVRRRETVRSVLRGCLGPSYRSPKSQTPEEVVRRPGSDDRSRTGGAPSPCKPRLSLSRNRLITSPTAYHTKTRARMYGNPENQGRWTTSSRIHSPSASTTRSRQHRARRPSRYDLRLGPRHPLPL